METLMNRSTLCIATAFLALPTLFASTAQACISCEYTPEVVRSSSTTYEGPGSYAHQRSYRAERVERVERVRPIKRIIKTTTARNNDDDDKPAKVKKQTASVTPPAPAVEQVATTEPTKIETKPALNENSSISVASANVAEVAPAPTVEAPKEVADAKPAGCKKFFPAVGMTVSVPCE
jgi:hypothetical protein